MTIDKQALREAAEKALPAMKRLLMMPNDELFDEALLNVDGDVDAANAFNLLSGPETMLTLLDELEAAQSENERMAKTLAERNGEPVDGLRKRVTELEAAKQDASKWFKAFEKAVSVGARYEERIAELESKLQTADKLQDSAFRHGLQHGFSYGQTSDQAGFEQCMESYSSRGKEVVVSGIGITKLDLPLPVHDNVHFADAAEIEMAALHQRLSELESDKISQAVTDVLAERQRQQSVEGWTPEHDDEHCNGELAMAAVCYINETGTVNRNGGKPWGWPWDASWWKPKGRRRNLVKAGALILAEIERLDRSAGIGKEA